MEVCGIICEYNPFHQGHAYHIRETRMRTGNAPVVCVMSGNFVQRGDFALLDKHTRAEAAVRCGADLVVELPVAFACATAERFAAGAVALLRALGCVRWLSFGSECADVSLLQRTAAATGSAQFSALLQKKLSGGVTFAAARQAAAAAIDPQAAQALSSPNDTLAVEYLRAADGAFTPLAIARQGVSHDEDTCCDGFSSASRLRTLAQRGALAQAAQAMPEESARLFLERCSCGAAPVFARNAHTAMMAVLRRMSLEDFAALPDISEGLEFRLHRLLPNACNPEEGCAAVKTKRYTLARLRRICMYAYLGLRTEDLQEAPAYIRVLAFNDTGREILRSAPAAIPLLIRPAGIRQMSDICRRQFSREAQATDLYVLACPDAARRCGGQEYTRSPVYVPGVHKLPPA